MTDSAPKLETHLLVAHLHNRSSISVFGNATSIDILKERLIQDTLVKSIQIYRTHADAPRSDVIEDRILSLNYTKLRQLRGS